MGMCPHRRGVSVRGARPGVRRQQASIEVARSEALRRIRLLTIWQEGRGGRQTSARRWRQSPKRSSAWSARL